MATGSAFVYRTAGSHVYTLLPAGVVTAWAMPVRVRDDWQRCGIRWTTEYTSDVGDTDTFDLTFFVAPWGPSFNLTATTLAVNETRSLVGPTVAEDVKEDVFVKTTAVLSTFRPWMSVGIIRADNDANANELWLLGCAIEVFPV